MIERWNLLMIYSEFMNKRNIIWVTGPSAAGKTVVIDELKKIVMDCEIYTDGAEILYLNSLDINHLHHIHPDGNEGFLLTSNFHFDESIRQLVKKLKDVPEDKKVLVELARGVGNNSEIDLSYSRFIDLVDEEIMGRSVLLYLKSGWEQRLERNKERRVYRIGHDLNKKSFYVPMSAMEGFFRGDDFDKMRSKLNCPVYVLDNQHTNEDELRKKVREVIRNIWV